jgi:methyl acetate hydrolase
MAMTSTKIDELLGAAVSDGTVAGVAVVLSGPEGVRYHGTAGHLSLEQGAPAVDSSTVFRIASMTKSLASVAALQLIERGELELEQPVDTVLPSFADLQVLEGFDGEQPRLRPPTRRATIRHLLTHTSGLGYFFSSAEMMRYHGVTGTPTVLEGLLAGLQVPLLFDAGERWEYGINVDWLGQVIEAVSGQTLGERLREEVFEPLGMNDTSFALTPERRERLMGLYSRTPDGGLVPNPLDFSPAPEFDAGGHGLYSTAHDYGRYMAALLGGGTLDGGRILRAQTVDLAFSDHLHGAPLPSIIRSAMPELSNDIPSLPVAQGWGLGFHLTLEDLEGMRRAGTGDWAGIFNCYYWIDRTSGVAGALFTQVLPFFDAQIVGLAVGVEQAAYASVAATA